MITKIFHLADLHIRMYRLHDEYKDSFKELLVQMTKLAEGLERDEMRIVIAGDIVHSKISISNELLILGTWLIMQLEKIAPVIIIAGNHDMLENNLDRVDSITPMVQFLPESNINYFKESKCYLDNNIVWCVYSIFEENAKPDIESARAEFGEDKTYVGIFHGPLAGAQTDLGFTIEHGANLEIFDGCDMVILGDIHKRSVFNYKGIPIVYPSSLLQQNFGENVSKHGFISWDVESRLYTEHDIENKYPYYKFRIKSLDDLTNDTEILVNA